MLPFHVVDRVAGLPVEETHIQRIEMNVAIDEERFRLPASRVTVEDDPSTPKHLLTVRGVGYRFVR